MEKLYVYKLLDIETNEFIRSQNGVVVWHNMVGASLTRSYHCKHFKHSKDRYKIIKYKLIECK